MKRIEMDKNTAASYRRSLEEKSHLIEELYDSRYVNALLYELGPLGAAIEIQWKRFGQIEFILLDRRQADELDTFVWALADFEWVVINPDERMQLQRLLISLGTRGIQTA